MNTATQAVVKTSIAELANEDLSIPNFAKSPPVTRCISSQVIRNPDLPEMSEPATTAAATTGVPKWTTNFCAEALGSLVFHGVLVFNLCWAIYFAFVRLTKYAAPALASRVTTNKAKPAANSALISSGWASPNLLMINDAIEPPELSKMRYQLTPSK